MRPVKTIKSSGVEEGPKILSYTGQTITLEEMDNAIAKGAVSARKTPESI